MTNRKIDSERERRGTERERETETERERERQRDRDSIRCQAEVVFVMESKLERQTAPASHHSASN